MSFKTEYHVDVSFLHDLVTMGHTAKVRSTKAPSAKVPSAKASIAKIQSADAESTNNNEENWARKRELSRQTKEARTAARDTWITNTDELEKYKQAGPLDEHMKKELFEAATQCDLSSPFDRFKNMWKNLTYRNKTIIQGYWNNERASLDFNDITKKPKISLAVLNFINEDVFNTLLQCIVTDLNSNKRNEEYLEKLAYFAKSGNVRERDAFKKIWKKLNFRAQDFLCTYFSMRINYQDQAKLCFDLKKAQENDIKRQWEIKNMNEQKPWIPIQNNVDENGWERL